MLVLVPLLIVAVLALFAAFATNRRGLRRFGEDEHAFVCRIRVSGRVPANWRRLPRRRWSRHVVARWEGETLIVRRGPVFDRPVRLPARVQSEVYLLRARSARLRGSRAVGVRLVVGSATLVEVAAFEYARMQLVGPYLTAALNDLPKAPAPRREI